MVVPTEPHVEGGARSAARMRMAKPVGEEIGTPQGGSTQHLSASKSASKHTGVVAAMQRAATEGSVAVSSIGLSAMALGGSSLQENAPTSTPVVMHSSEELGVTPRETPTPTSTATTSADRSLFGSDAPRTGMEISPDQEELPAARKQINEQQDNACASGANGAAKNGI